MSKKSKSKRIRDKNEAFVYVWTNNQNKKVYVGYHKGTSDDGYVSSGKRFLQVYNADPTIFSREIIFTGTKYECLEQEYFTIKKYVNEYGYDKLYNITHWSYLKENHLKCIYCDAICDPNNLEWVEHFELWHFANCSKKKEWQRKQEGKNPPSKKFLKNKYKDRKCKCPLCNDFYQ